MAFAVSQQLGNPTVKSRFLLGSWGISALLQKPRAFSFLMVVASSEDPEGETPQRYKEPSAMANPSFHLCLPNPLNFIRNEKVRPLRPGDTRSSLKCCEEQEFGTNCTCECLMSEENLFIVQMCGFLFCPLYCESCILREQPPCVLG